jgi:hypothetical protein
MRDGTSDTVISRLAARSTLPALRMISVCVVHAFMDETEAGQESLKWDTCCGRELQKAPIP